MVESLLDIVMFITYDANHIRLGASLHLYDKKTGKRKRMEKEYPRRDFAAEPGR